MTFLVLSLPRSRSFWLSRFLTYGEWACGHEELRHMRSLDDVTAWFSQGCTGTAETAAAPFWRLIGENVRIVTVRRPVKQVVDSLMNLPGLVFDRARLEAAMRRHDRKLDQLEARIPGLLSVTFDELNDEETCRRVFEHCLPYVHDHEHWARLAPLNQQCNMLALMRYQAAYAPTMEKLGKIAKHQMLSRLAVREPVTANGMTIQTEDFETWLRDAPALFDEHLVGVGEAPEDWAKKNIPLMRTLYDAGCMQIMTGRSNGRMFGYLMTFITPSMTSKSVTTATNATFYASPDAPGLGLKLQRASLKALKERGADEVFYECGARGSGPRLSTMYRRLGAQEHGQVYRLQLTEH